MTKKEFQILPRGSIFQVPGERKLFTKSLVYFGGKKQDLLYDGKYTVILPDDIPYGTIAESDQFIYRPRDVHGNYLEAINKNQEKLREIDRIQKKKGNILWRYVWFPYADGYAIYQIIHTTKKYVRLLHVTGIGDDWEIPELLDGSIYPRYMAEENIAYRRIIKSFRKK